MTRQTMQMDLTTAELIRSDWVEDCYPLPKENEVRKVPQYWGVFVYRWWKGKKSGKLYYTVTLIKDPTVTPQNYRSMREYDIKCAYDIIKGIANG